MIACICFNIFVDIDVKCDIHNALSKINVDKTYILD